MKTGALISILFILSVSSCSECRKQGTVKELELNIDKAEWYTTISKNGFGQVHLKIEGSTNGKQVTVETYGDGIIGCEELPLDENNRFCGDVVILFRHQCDSLPGPYRTYVYVYEKRESPRAVHTDPGTTPGKTARRMIESGLLMFEKIE